MRGSPLVRSQNVLASARRTDRESDGGVPIFQNGGKALGALAEYKMGLVARRALSCQCAVILSYVGSGHLCPCDMSSTLLYVIDHRRSTAELKCSSWAKTNSPRINQNLVSFGGTLEPTYVVNRYKGFLVY